MFKIMEFFYIPNNKFYKTPPIIKELNTSYLRFKYYNHIIKYNLFKSPK